MAEEKLLFDFDSDFFRGMKSDMDPCSVPMGYYWSGMNVINIGGLISCRPGYRCIVKFPQGKLQGATIFRPKVGIEQMLVCVSGVVYVAPYPFTNFTVVPNVLMSPDAKQVYWQLTTQSARRKTTDFSSLIEVIDPKAVLFIQDGGLTAPAWFDGSNSGHIRDNLFETPAGGPMAWVGDRLWVAIKDRVVASDIANPFSFREQTYLGGSDAFYFKTPVTAMAPTSSLEFAQLVVFTEENGSIIQANLRDRSQWPLIDGMQTEVFQVGCQSQRSLVTHFARLAWFSSSGIVIFDSATAAKLEARLPIRDNEMMVSKTGLSDDLTQVAGAAFGQFILMSVPNEDAFNKHTWVMNHASKETLSDDSGPSWSGFWTGTRPVEWVYGVIAGHDRIYHVSADEDGENRLWEAFIEERLDNGCPITWYLATRGHFGDSSKADKLPGSNCRYMFSDLDLCNIEEDLDLGVFYAGGTRGAFKRILGKQIRVERGALRNDQEITAGTTIYAFKPQSRRERTQDANQQSTEEETGTCPVETEDLEIIDDSFQLLIVGHGPFTMKWVRSFALETPEDKSGEPNACVSETKLNAIRFDGAGVQSDDIAELIAELAEKPIAHFTSVKTATVTSEGLTAVGVGSAESIVSQEAADRVATRIAERAAEIELINSLPNDLSAGEGFDE